ncbi:penicillin-binding protein [Streptomyces harbinensis]|uniref:penicillin-binding transpeptidase domain-containing protein n=1 Tax=Streptomyces harbinensis TaxID=1176198 RepID=UPI001591493C|nr:penicillin-binding transpeptidase domain-containing protein [Streptomyces harbinensis]QKV68831.1 penicillin-binding protein [Streptomyces harbinensis]
MRNGQKVAVIAGVFVVVAAGAGFGAYSMLGDDDGPGTQNAAATSDDTPDDGAAPPSEAEVLEVSGDFLDAWAAGDAAGAAALTDDAAAAEEALASLAEEAAVTDLTLSAGTPEGESVPFSVAASIGYEDLPVREWSYDSELTVVRDAASGEIVVDWEPSVLHPGLDEGLRIETGPGEGLPPVTVLDAEGGELTAAAHPTLAHVLEDIAGRFAAHAGGSPAVVTRIADAEGGTVEELLELAEPVPGEVPTTIVPAIQAAAEAAVADKDRAAVVAIQPSTGAIQGLANAPADGFDTALQGSYAPGSTFKIVTAGLLIDEGLASAGAKHPCPKYFEHGGWQFQNLDKFEIKDGTFADSFAASCNTAFISQAPELSDEALGDYARDVFGLGLTWSVGVATLDGAVPTQSLAQMAASLIGQGGVRMNPMTMASVSATVKSGTFRQPYLVPAGIGGRELATATGPSAATAEELRSLMHRTAVGGTAAEAMSGLDGDIGAKTGSAEVDGQDKPNAWFTGYRNDLAVAAVVPDSGHGGSNAGPVVAQVLAAAP